MFHRTIDLFKKPNGLNASKLVGVQATEVVSSSALPCRSRLTARRVYAGAFNSHTHRLHLPTYSTGIPADVCTAAQLAHLDLSGELPDAQHFQEPSTYMKSVRLPSCYASLLQLPARSAVFTCVLTVLQIPFFLFSLFCFLHPYYFLKPY